MKIYNTYSLIIFVSHLLFFEKCFLFSIIIPIYNTGRYLDDSIGSLLNQTINFNEIQIILVSDGCTDITEEICLNYQKKYKNSIIYIKSTHGGVSKARNLGLNYAKGEYINFLDADDKWGYQAFKHVLLFFETNRDIDLVAGRIKFFEAEDNYHPLDYKFYKTRRVNLNEDYMCIQLSVSSCFFKRIIIEGKYFDESVFYCEDARFVNSILLIKPIMGLIKEAIYYYRRRSDFSSAIQNQKQDLNFYFGTLNSVANYLINSSKVLYNKILPFIQFLVIYDLIFRIQSQACIFLKSKDFRKYNRMIKEILEQIDDKYIFEQKAFSNRYKLFTLSKKYNRDLRYDIELKDDLFIYSKYKLLNLKSNKKIIEWKILNIKNNILYLEAIDNLWLPRENYSYFIKLGNKIFSPKFFENPNYDFFTLEGLTQKGRTIVFEIPLGTINLPQTLYFYISYMDNEKEVFTSLGRFSHIPPISNGYYTSDKYIIKYMENRLTLFEYNRNLELEFEYSFCKELQKVRKEYIIHLRKYIKANNYIENQKKFDLWIINDRRERAGDNGEYFFRYLKLKRPAGIKCYFAIQGDSIDYERLKKLGDILDLNSKEYIKLFIKSDKIISSVSYSWVDNPFNKDRIYVTDLIHFDFVLLQNGIIKDDLSKTLNRLNKNYSLFITSTKKEYKSILNSNYGYNKENIILTGMSRYDNLYRLKNIIKKKKIILIMPTWRGSFRVSKDFESGGTISSNKFVLTKFYEFYNNLLNNEKLLLIMKKRNYTGIFCLHPFLETLSTNFNQNELFSVKHKCDYQKFLLESSLLITDYSSIFFDFGYIRKPIIYAHFDYEEYKNINYKKGFFDYKKDGFGPICQDIQCIIDEIQNEIENRCIMRKKYLKRIEKFFTFWDDNNNERILTGIMKTKYLIKNDGNNIMYIFYVLFLFLFLYKLKNYFINMFLDFLI